MATKSFPLAEYGGGTYYVNAVHGSVKAKSNEVEVPAMTIESISLVTTTVTKGFVRKEFALTFKNPIAGATIQTYFDSDNAPKGRPSADTSVLVNNYTLRGTSSKANIVVVLGYPSESLALSEKPKWGIADYNKDVPAALKKDIVPLYARVKLSTDETYQATCSIEASIYYATVTPPDDPYLKPFAVTIAPPEGAYNLLLGTVKFTKGSTVVSASNLPPSTPSLDPFTVDLTEEGSYAIGLEILPVFKNIAYGSTNIYSVEVKTLHPPVLSYNSTAGQLEWEDVEGATSYEIYKDGELLGTVDTAGKFTPKST